MKKVILTLIILAGIISLTACNDKAAPIQSASDAYDNVIEEISAPEVNTEETEADAGTADTITTVEEKSIPEVLLEQKLTVRFDENGEFRILVFGDVQSGPPSPCKQTLDGIELIVDREQPDLVLFAGDNSVGCGSEAVLRKYITSMVKSIESRNIPWAHVYGNHDDEGVLSRKKQQEVYEKFDYCLSKSGPDEIKGTGNYVIPVYSSDTERTDPVFAVWGLDSGAYVTDKGLAGNDAKLSKTMFRGHPESGYAYMPFSQVRWYYDTSEEIEGFAGHKVPGLMYFHIPLQEFYEIYMNPKQTGLIGVKNDPVCAGPLNSGMFTAIIERGDVKAVCCGHDHINDYSGEFCGVKLCYSSNIGYDTYHDDSMMGGRMFIIKESSPSEVETYISYVNGYGPGNTQSSSEVNIDFDSGSSYTLTDGLSTASGIGADGTNGLIIDGKGELSLVTPFIVSNARYIRLWADTTETDSLDAISLLTPTGERLTASSGGWKLAYREEGSDEWKDLAAGTSLSKGFRGYISLSLGSFKGTQALKHETVISGFELSVSGSIIIDNINAVQSYRK